MGHPYQQNYNRQNSNGTDWGYVLRRLLPGGILCLTVAFTWLGVILITKALVDLYNGGHLSNGGHRNQNASQAQWQGSSHHQQFNSAAYTPKTGAYSYTYHQTDSSTQSDRGRVDAHAERNRQRQAHNETRRQVQEERRRQQQERQAEQRERQAEQREQRQQQRQQIGRAHV